jgi:hypothetical protein
MIAAIYSRKSTDQRLVDLGAAAGVRRKHCATPYRA